VRNYCHLSDLSPGGCYLEMPLAFEAGVTVEIVGAHLRDKVAFDRSSEDLASQLRDGSAVPSEHQG